MKTSDIRSIAASIAKELSEYPDHWTREVYARDAEGHEICPTSPDAACWCLEGHVMRRLGVRSGVDAEEEFREFSELADLVMPRMCQFNDAPSRTVFDIIAACEKVAASPGPVSEAMRAQVAR